MGDKCREIVTQPGQHKNVYWVQDNNGRQAHIAHTKRTHTQVAQRHKTCASPAARECKNLSKNCRTMCVNGKGSSAGEALAAQHLPIVSIQERLERFANYRPRYETRSGMVAPSAKVMERRPHTYRPGRLSNGDRCVHDRLGGHGQEHKPSSSGILESPFKSNAIKLPRNDGSNIGFKITHVSNRQTNSSVDRQYHHGSLHQSFRRAESGSVAISERHMDGSSRQKTHTKCTIPERLPQYDSGRPLETFRTLRMATQQGPVSVFKSYVGPTHNRPLRNAHKHTVTQLQQQVRGSVFFGDRRPRPKGLGQAQQFCESTIQNDSTSFEGHRGTRGKSNPNSTMVASATVVSKAETIVDNAPLKTTQNGTHTGAQNNAGGMQKQEMTHICLETMWANHTTELQWPSRASQQISCCLAPSTLSAYNSMLRQLHAFCDRGHIQFPPMHTKDVAQFLCELADKSQAPRSEIKVAMSAMTHMFANYGVRNLFQDYHLKILIDALVKSGTQVPMNRSKVMPIRPFRELFNKWPVNGDLSVKELRLKAITLLALTLMLRPSDIAPKAVHFDSSLGTTTAFVFSTDHVEFCNDGANITLHGIKNDTTRTGFAVFLQPTKEAKLNPVQALRDYIDCTQQVRPPAKPVFLTLTAPYKAISASTAATILNEAIKLAGLDGMGYSAKSFRPTGATAAIDMHCDPDIAMRLGRWKTRSVFYEHYVHSKPPASLFSDIIELHQ